MKTLIAGLLLSYGLASAGAQNTPTPVPPGPEPVPVVRGGGGSSGGSGGVQRRLHTVVERSGAAEPAGVFWRGEKPFGRQKPGRTLVITARPLDPDTSAHLEEDMGVMSYLLRKEVDDLIDDDRKASAMGIVIHDALDGRLPSSMYLDGYGALFFLNVKFPLLAPPQRKEAKPEPAGDSNWEKAKRELYGGRPGEQDPSSMRPYKAEAPYDQKQVDDLKRAILQALKNGGNIRHLKSDEYITVTVSGRDSGGAWPNMVNFPEANYQAFAVEGGKWMARSGSSGGSSVLTVRVKKSEVDSFSKGKMDLEEFRQKAAMHISASNLGDGPAPMRGLPGVAR